MAASKRKAKRKKSAPDEAPPAAAPPPIAELPARSNARRNLLLFVATLYLGTVWLDGVGSNLPAKLAPRPWVYFGQTAALFRWAGQKQIDYRAEGWLCSERRWTEIDVRPYFPVDRDNKESRFYRAVQFYRRDRKVMRALDAFVVGHHNTHDDGSKIGGVRFLSLRIPYPPVGSHIEPYERKPLSDHPADQRHDWYWTPRSMRRQRCGEHASPRNTSRLADGDRDDDDQERDAGSASTPEDER